jgi:membrane protease YdiL (CAAX protease family)
MKSSSILPKLVVLVEVLFVQFILVGGSQKVIMNLALWKSMGGVEQNALVHIPSLLIPILLILLFRWDFVKFGLSFRDANLALLIALTAYLPALTARLPIALTDYTKLSGGIIIAIVHLLALTIWAWKLQKNLDPKVGIIAILVSAAVFGGIAYSQNILPKFDQITLSFTGALFAVLCEEVLWRGYIQTRLNEVFGVPFSFFGISWGWGLVISSILFGFAHVLNANPATQQIGWYWGWGIWTTCTGLFYGLLREKTGGILAPFIIHGLPQAIALAVGL